MSSIIYFRFDQDRTSLYLFYKSAQDTYQLIKICLQDMSRCTPITLCNKCNATPRICMSTIEKEIICPLITKTGMCTDTMMPFGTELLAKIYEQKQHILVETEMLKSIARLHIDLADEIIFIPMDENLLDMTLDTLPPTFGTSTPIEISDKIKEMTTLNISLAEIIDANKKSRDQQQKKTTSSNDNILRFNDMIPSSIPNDTVSNDTVSNDIVSNDGPGTEPNTVLCGTVPMAKVDLSGMDQFCSIS
jgi:hypothetical protein